MTKRIALSLAALAYQRQTPQLLYRTLPLWIFMAVYWAFSIRSHINIGHRHLLPIYPCVYVLTGAAAWWLTRRKLAATLCTPSSLARLPRQRAREEHARKARAVVARPSGKRIRPHHAERHRVAAL